MSWEVSGKHLPLLVEIYLPPKWINWLDTQLWCVGLRLGHGFRLRLLGYFRVHGELIQQH